MNKVNIGIDVDLTTLASDFAWWRWLHYMSHGITDDMQDPADALRAKIESDCVLNYYLPSYFPDMLNENVHPMDFWRNEGVYDTVAPVPGAVECITALMKRNDTEITFVTHNKGNGGRSKFNLLSRLFGRGNFNMIVTREKHLANIHCLVDDRLEFLNLCAERGIAPFVFYTNYSQDGHVPHDNSLYCCGWNQTFTSIESWIELGCPARANAIMDEIMPIEYLCDRRNRSKDLIV